MSGRWKSKKMTPKKSKKSMPTEGFLASRYHSAYRAALMEKARIENENYLIARETGQIQPPQHIWQLGGLPVFRVSPVLPKIGKWHKITSSDDVKGHPLTEPFIYGLSDYYEYYKNKPFTGLPKDVITRPLTPRSDVFYSGK